MSDGVGPIVVHGVSKRFRRGTRADSLRDVLRQWTSRRPAAGDDDFWALRDVSCRVAPGEVLGIIGANGSGKSTLLKLLAGVMPPTQGRIETYGRLGVLLELAAGFHPDLTGRENVHLQGALLGMPAALVRRRFDDIVAFAGVEAFIDTPVKRFSSGMHARLGFSIAVHMEPDALLIDEVLAVGDFVFQERAFARLAAVARSGIPVVVVSHQLERLTGLCTHGLVLQGGTVAFAGGMADAVRRYVGASSRASAPADTTAAVHLEAIDVLGSNAVPSGGWCVVRVSGVLRDAARADEVEAVGLRLRSLATGDVVSVTSNVRCGAPVTTAGPFVIEARVQANVPPGPYTIEVHPWDRRAERTTQPSLVAALDVGEGPSFLGRVQLNAAMQVLPP